MSNDLSQALFFGLLVEMILTIVALRYPDKRKQIAFLMICTAIVGGIAYGPRTLALINPPPTPNTLTNPITHIYDDFNNSANDGGIDASRWEVSGDPNTCDVSQNNGELTIKNSPSSNLAFSGCFLSGALEGVGGSSFKLFEAKALARNDFQGTCCSMIALELSSVAFSGGGGISCAIHAGPGFISGVFAITHGETESEYRKQVDTTYNDWHMLRLEISQADYTVSCYIDGNLIGSTIPRDASDLYESTYSRYIQAGWPKDTSGTFQIDDVRIIP